MTSRIPDWQVAAEAADWVTRIDGGPLNADERVGLAEWLKLSPAHVDELLFSASIMAGLTQVDMSRSLSIEELLADTAPDIIPLFHGSDAPDDVESEIVTELKFANDSEEASYSPEDHQSDRPVIRYWPALVASLLAVLAVSWYGLSSRLPDETGAIVAGASEFATAGEEQRSIVLADGSVLYLKAHSRARVVFSESRRLIELVEGEALFDVAHDRDRPFRVFAGDTVTEAVGTRFTVGHGDGLITVAVMEGEVLVGTRLGGSVSAGDLLENDAIADSRVARQPVRLTAGQRVQLLESGAPVPPVTNAAAALAPVELWPARQLSFHDEGLSVIAAEFNRFNAVKIVVADAELARTRFSGVFDAHDPESFIAFLELSAGVRVERPHEDQVVLIATDD